MRGKEFDVVILGHFCKGCGLCVEYCRQGKLYLVPKPNKRGVRVAGVRPEADCTGCLQCATICPDAAVEVTQRGAPGGEPIEQGPHRRGAERNPAKRPST